MTACFRNFRVWVCALAVLMLALGHPMLAFWFAAVDLILLWLEEGMYDFEDDVCSCCAKPVLDAAPPYCQDCHDAGCP